jgi:uncharacterized membrane protein
MQFSESDEQHIVLAIRDAENASSGEIRLFVEDFCLQDDPLDRAAAIFHKAGMDKTRERNGVLVYLAPKSRHFAIWGDEGIHQAVGNSFWNAEKQLLTDYLREDRATEGICAVIRQIGDKLKTYFPADPHHNPNELSDDILYG